MHSTIVRRSADSTHLILLGHYFILMLFLLAALIYRLVPSVQASDATIYALTLALLGLTAWSLWSWHAFTKSLFDFYVMFFLAAVLFNGGHALLEVLHLNADGILGGQFPPRTIIQSLFIVVLGLAFFHFGALVAVSLLAPKAVHSHPLSHPAQTAYYLRVVGWSLLLISAVPSFLVLQQALRVSVSQGYFALYQQESVAGFASSLDLLAKFLIPGVLFLLAGSKGHPWSLAVSVLVILSYTVANFILGSRIEATGPLLAYVWLWHRRIRPLAGPVLILAGIGMLGILFPFIKVTRNLTSGAKLDLAMLVEAYASVDNPLVAIISEMGFSLRTVAHTVQLVPEVRGFDLGLSYVYASLTIFPNLFWDIHPTVAHGLAAGWLVRTVAPSLASIGGGYGFSFIAEAYLNFGWLGITIVLAIIGGLLAAFVVWGQKTDDPARLALLASFGASFMIFARGESGSIVRDFVWYALIPYAIVRIMPSFFRRKDNVA